MYMYNTYIHIKSSIIIYTYIQIYIYSDPKVDRIFFGGCRHYVGIVLDIGKQKQ